ncbi:MAG: MFS transporter [Patescibacteria group bacterium]|nr:MFS transporter [Patescibacteria group bacterium]
MPRKKINKKGIAVIYLLGFAISLSDSVSGYVQSSFLSNSFNTSTIGAIMALSALLTVFASFLYPKLIAKLNNQPTTLFVSFIVMVTSLILAFSNIKPVIITAFIIRYVGLILLLVNLDIFLENKSDDKHTGAIRSKYLTITNIAWLMSPILMGKLIKTTDYSNIFNFSFAILAIVIIFTILFKKSIAEKEKYDWHEIEIKQTLKTIWEKINLRRVFIAALALQIFYAIAVLYVPIKLNQELGLSWSSISIIFIFMLLPFIIFQYPAGLIADKYLGEKEMMIGGSIILILASIIIAKLTSTSVFAWSLALFFSRVGAAIYETMQETYFYKHVDSSDISLITMFRQTRPAGWLIGSLIAFVFLSFITISQLFYIVAFIFVLNLFNLAFLKDTK